MARFPEPRLDHLYDAHVDLEPAQVVGQTPMGMRQIYIVKGGTLEGPKLKGTVLPGGGDWATIRPDGALQLDVRAAAKLDDGPTIYVYYLGILFGQQDTIMRALSGEDIPLSDYYFYISPMFQTGAPEYDWLNRTVAIGRGKVVKSGVEYSVWAATGP